MTKFTKEHLQQIAEDGFLKHGEAKEMARQLLASMEQEPVYQVLEDGSWTDYSNEQLDSLLESKPSTLFRVAYAAPQLPQPAVPETLPCPVMLEPGLRFGKGIRTQAMLDALQRRAEYYADLEALTPEQRADHDAGLKEFASMLQSNCCIKPVADLFEVTVPSGRSTTFTTDAAEAKDCADMGWKVQEYVTLERYQVVMLQNAEPDFREISNSSTKHFRENAKTSTRCPKCSGRGSYHCPMMLGTVECECTLPAALQQEVKK